LSYSAGEAAILARLRAMTQFDQDNSSRGDWRILNKGKSAYYAVVKPGEHTREMIGRGMRRNNYTTIIQLWQKYKDDGLSMIDLETLLEATITHLDRYPHVGSTTGTIEDAQVVSVGEFIQTPTAEPHWIYVDLLMAWQEEALISYAE